MAYGVLCSSGEYMVQSCLGDVVTYRWSSWQSDQVLRMIELKRQRGDFIFHLSFEASHAAANGVAAVYAPLLQPANEPSA